METIGLHLVDVMDLAIRMEHTAAQFYQTAGEAVRDLEKRSLLLGLSAVEKEHAATFERMKESIEGNAPPDSEVDALVAGFLSSWIEGEVSYTKPELATELARSGSLGEILAKAVEMEKDAISFYSGLRSYIASSDAEEAVAEIMREELGHVVDLSRALKEHESSR